MCKRLDDNRLRQAKENKILTKEKYEAMSPLDKHPGKFYELFKVYKVHSPPNLPPGRPVISGCGSFTENISKFVDHHAKGLVPEIKSYIQDTPDLLRQFEELKTHTFTPGTFPVSIDVVGLYPNIPHKEGFKK